MGMYCISQIILTYFNFKPPYSIQGFLPKLHFNIVEYLGLGNKFYDKKVIQLHYFVIDIYLFINVSVSIMGMITLLGILISCRHSSS